MEPVLLSPTPITANPRIGSMSCGKKDDRALLGFPCPASWLPKRRDRRSRRGYADHGGGDPIEAGRQRDSSSGGNGGLDKMPESNRAVRPESQQHHPNDK
jgi:hypothetical protein